MGNLRVVESTSPLRFSCVLDPLPDLSRRSSICFAPELFVRHRGNFDMHIDAIEKWTAHLREIPLNDARRAAAFSSRVPIEAARAWIHRGDQHQACREG